VTYSRSHKPTSGSGRGKGMIENWTNLL